MNKFLKRLFHLRREKLTLIVWRNSNPEEPESYTLRPINAMIAIMVIFIVFAMMLNALVLFTPIRYVIIDRIDHSFRTELLQITDRLAQLQDSLNVRDNQLSNIRNVIRTSADTVFAVSTIRENAELLDERLSTPNRLLQSVSVADELRVPRVPDFSFDFSPSESMIFPVEFPVRGLVSGTHSPETGHFGIDIAANAGAPIRNIARGIVVNAEWSINYGYTIKVQHSDGYLSVYKHSTTPTRNTGEFINKGDILGSVSKSGLVSTGPHLHFELWRNGRPLDPLNYLIN